MCLVSFLFSLLWYIFCAIFFFFPSFYPLKQFTVNVRHIFKLTHTRCVLSCENLLFCGSVLANVCLLHQQAPLKLVRVADMFTCPLTLVDKTTSLFGDLEAPPSGEGDNLPVNFYKSTKTSLFAVSGAPPRHDMYVQCLERSTIEKTREKRLFSIEIIEKKMAKWDEHSKLPLLLSEELVHAGLGGSGAMALFTLGPDLKKPSRS